MADDNATPDPTPAAAPVRPAVPDFTGTAHFESQEPQTFKLRGAPEPPARMIIESGG